MKRLIVLMTTIILLSTSTIYASGEDWAIGENSICRDCPINILRRFHK